jgi:hypothetical protein
VDGSGWFWIAVAVINMAFWSAMAPVLKGLADRVRGHPAMPEGLEERIRALEDTRPITGETDLIYQRMAELEERVDFAERLLAPPNVVAVRRDAGMAE